jgi:hypothetical protein
MFSREDSNDTTDHMTYYYYHNNDIPILVDAQRTPRSSQEIPQDRPWYSQPAPLNHEKRLCFVYVPP